MLSPAQQVSRVSGYVPSLPTPFAHDDKLDEAAFSELCARQIAAGAPALVICGLLGEAPNLTPGERTVLTRVAVAVSCGRVPVIVDVTSNATDHAVALAGQAASDGADAIMAATPYYNRPTQAGVRAHFESLLDLGIPAFLHDVPALTACTLANETVAELAAHPSCIGLIDATGDLLRAGWLRNAVPAPFRLLSGDDATAPAFIGLGGDGCLSSVSNVAPALCNRALLPCLFRNEHQPVQDLNALTACLSASSNPPAIKYALSLLTSMPARVRLPLVDLPAATKAAIEAILRRLYQADPTDLIGASSSYGALITVSGLPSRNPMPAD